MRRFLLAVFLLSSAALPAQDDPLWHYIHPKARALVGVEWKRVAASEVGRLVRDQLAGSGLPSFPGSALLDGIERILISSPGNPTSNKSNAPALIAVAGQFAPDAVRQAMANRTAVSHYRGYEILSPPRSQQSGEMQLAMVSTGLLLLGDPVSLRSTLDSKDGNVPSGPVIARAHAAARDNDIWAVFDVPPSSLAGGSAPQAAAFKDIRGLDLGVSFREGLAVSLTLQAASGQKANQLAQAVAGLIALASMQAASQADAQQLSRKLRMDAKGNEIHLALALSADELRQGIQSARNSLQRRTSAAPAPPPAKPGVIRVYGMADDPVEIPMKRDKP